MKREKLISNSAEQTIEIAETLISSFENKNLNVFISGDLGAGKTHFTKGIFLGIGLKKAATSPTFDLITSYKHHNLLVNHIDLYRLHVLSLEDEIWLSEVLEEKALNVVEWANKFDLDVTAKKTVYVNIIKKDENVREIEIFTY